MHVSPPDRYSFLSKLPDLARRLCPEKVASRKRLAAFLVVNVIMIYRRWIMSTEAQKRASAKYQREKTKQVNLKFSPNEMDMYNWLQQQDAPLSSTIKRLIRQEMQKNI